MTVIVNGAPKHGPASRAVISGGRRCGACRYTLPLETMPRAHACHCHQRQRWSGSAFSLNLPTAEDRLRVEGRLITLELVTGDRVSTQRPCPDCHGRIDNMNSRRLGVTVVRAGTLDRSEKLDGLTHIFKRHRQRRPTRSLRCFSGARRD